MNKLKAIIRKLLFPNIAVIIINTLVSAVLLIYTFVRGREYSAIGYVSYLLSAYALTIVCVRIPSIIRRTKRFIHKTETAHKYFTDDTFRIGVSLYTSLTVNSIYASIKLFTGLFYKSLWFITLAVYYIMLTFMRFLLLRQINSNNIGNDYIAELKVYRICGVILLFMNVALSIIVTMVVVKNKGFKYFGILIYVMAAYTFYTTINSIVNVVKYHKLNSPVLSAAKTTNLVAALVSMLSLETAMVAQFGDDEIFRRNITAVTGAVVCFVVLGTAIYMIVSSTVKIHKLPKQQIK